MRTLTITSAALLCATLATPAAAIYLPPDIAHVPVDRLLKNIEANLATASADDKVTLQLALARVHATAYAKKSAAAAIWNPTTITFDKTRADHPEQARISGAIHNAIQGRVGLMNRLSGPIPPGAPAGACRPETLRERMDLQGSITIAFELPASKRASVAPVNGRIVRSTLDDDILGACLLLHLTTAQLPTSDSPVSVEQTITFTQKPGPLSPFDGHGDFTVPAKVKAASDPNIAAAAKAHLDAARDAYYQVVKAHPDNALAHLGLSWTLEQLGMKDKAIICYRKAFDIAWEREGKLQGLRLGQAPIAWEAANHLIPLLDKDKDAAEITRLESARSRLMSLPRPITPIVIPLTDESRLSELVDPDAAVAFDLDGSGDSTRRWGWVRPAAGWLVWRGGSHDRVTSGLQLFGGVTFWAFWRDGYQALAALDDDGDGWIAGGERQGLAIWRDADSDGVSDPGEVRSLDQWGIVALATASIRHATGVPFNPRGVTLKGGATRPSYDWVSHSAGNP